MSGAAVLRTKDDCARKQAPSPDPQHSYGPVDTPARASESRTFPSPSLLGTASMPHTPFHLSPSPPVRQPPRPLFPDSHRTAGAATRCRAGRRNPAAGSDTRLACGSEPLFAYVYIRSCNALHMPLSPVQSVPLAASQLAVARLQLGPCDVKKPCPECVGVVPHFQNHVHKGVVLGSHSISNPHTRNKHGSKALKACQAFFTANLLTSRILVKGVLDGV